MFFHWVRRCARSVKMCVAASVNNPTAWQTNRLPGRNSNGCSWPTAVISSAPPPDNTDWKKALKQTGEKVREKHYVAHCVCHVSRFRSQRLSITSTGSGKSVVGLPTPAVLFQLHRDVSASGEAARLLRRQEKTRPAEEECGRTQLLPEFADRAVRGFEINVDKVGWAPATPLVPQRLVC